MHKEGIFLSFISCIFLARAGVISGNVFAVRARKGARASFKICVVAFSYAGNLGSLRVKKRPNITSVKLGFGALCAPRAACPCAMRRRRPHAAGIRCVIGQRVIWHRSAGRRSAGHRSAGQSTARLSSHHRPAGGADHLRLHTQLGRGRACFLHAQGDVRRLADGDAGGHHPNCADAAHQPAQGGLSDCVGERECVWRVEHGAHEVGT